MGAVCKCIAACTINSKKCANFSTLSFFNFLISMIAKLGTNLHFITVHSYESSNFDFLPRSYISNISTFP